MALFAQRAVVVLPEAVVDGHLADLRFQQNSSVIQTALTFVVVLVGLVARP